SFLRCPEVSPLPQGLPPGPAAAAVDAVAAGGCGELRPAPAVADDGGAGAYLDAAGPLLSRRERRAFGVEPSQVVDVLPHGFVGRACPQEVVGQELDQVRHGLFRAAAPGCDG